MEGRGFLVEADSGRGAADLAVEALGVVDQAGDGRIKNNNANAWGNLSGNRRANNRRHAPLGR